MNFLLFAHSSVTAVTVISSIHKAVIARLLYVFHVAYIHNKRKLTVNVPVRTVHAVYYYNSATVNYVTSLNVPAELHKICNDIFDGCRIKSSSRLRRVIGAYEMSMWLSPLSKGHFRTQ